MRMLSLGVSPISSLLCWFQLSKQLCRCLALHARPYIWITLHQENVWSERNNVWCSQCDEKVYKLKSKAERNGRTWPQLLLTVAVVLRGVQVAVLTPQRAVLLPLAGPSAFPHPAAGPSLPLAIYGLRWALLSCTQVTTNSPALIATKDLVNIKASIEWWLPRKASELTSLQLLIELRCYRWWKFCSCTRLKDLMTARLSIWLNH